MIDMLPLVIIIAALAVLVPLAFIVGIYQLLSAPLHRQQRAGFFLDLLETGMAEGHSPETTVVEISKSRDTTLGHRFHRLAAHLEAGLRLSDALKKVPGFLPPQLVAMFAVGEQIGDIRKVLPACRKALAGGSSKTTSAINYLVIVILLLNPFGGLIWPFLTIFIVPKFHEIFSDLLEGRPPPPLFSALVAHHLLISVIQIGLMVVSVFVLLAYAFGPRGIPWLAPVLKPLMDAVNCRLPWRRKRLERDFSAMLALLLDAEVPEEQAVMLAAQSTDNDVFSRRCAVVSERLRAGVPLTEAVQALDETGEFRWRLANAAHGQGGFMNALTGWHDALEAKAYQLEQTASQGITTGLVVVNGCLVGLIAVGVFQTLTSVVWGLALW